MAPDARHDGHQAEAPGADAIVLEARGLSLAYGSLDVVVDVDWIVRCGEFWFLLGPNGTGKSTLLKSIFGVVRPRKGTLTLAPELAGGRRIGFVPQRCNLRSTLPLTVAEFVRMGLTRTGIRGREARENLAMAIDDVGLESASERNYGSLSGGQRQRALVARALVRRPDLLILDEPTNGLDLPAEESFLALVARLNRERGLTLILVTHAIALAARYASHVALITSRRVIAGTRAEVLTGERLRAAYGVAVDITYDAAQHPAVRVGCHGECP
jgi:ABC-type Mn2+/Zn2+ transport system ATPase subunit